MSVAYTVEFNVRPGELDRFMDLLTEVLDAMREEPMFLNATLHADPGDPAHFLLHETWRDHADVVQFQLERPYRREWHTALPALLQTDRKVATWTPLRADAAASPAAATLPCQPDA